MVEPICLLGIDVGGTAVKVGLFDLDGHLLGLHQTVVPIESPQPGWAEIDPHRWLSAVRSGVGAVLDHAGVPPESVAAIGLSNMIGTVVPLNVRGQPLRPAITYYDTRSAREAAWMLERAPKISEITANRVSAGNTTLTSVLWIRQHQPDIYVKTFTFAQTNTFLFHWLTGETWVDWTNASFMGLFDYRTMTWHPGLAERLELDLKRLASIHAPHSSAPLRGSASAVLGLRANIPVAIGGIDGAMSSVGVGAIHAGDAFDVSGTSEMIAVCLPRPIACPELLARWHVVPDMWTLIGAISTPGAALQWFRDQLYTPGAEEDAQALYAAMTTEADVSPPGANGIVFLPHMMGERAPIWDPHARGVFFGLSLSTTRGDMIRAVMEGAAYAVRHLIQLIESHGGIQVRRVVTIGGAARNPLWRQIKADIWGVELVLPPLSEATVLGAAITAGVGSGFYEDYEDAVERAVPRGGEVTYPGEARRKAYEHAYRVYRKLYPALADCMRFSAHGGSSR